MKQVLAKGKSDDYMSLYDHTNHVVTAIETLADQYGMDRNVARNGAILHDLGKAHPAFQAMIIQHPKEARAGWLQKLPASEAITGYLTIRDGDQHPLYRHELGSLGFLSLFTQNEWPQLIEMVVGHHKSVHNDKSGRGIMDLARDESPEDVMELHLKHWHEWSEAASQIAVQFGVAYREISYKEACENFLVAFEYVIKAEKGWSAYRGLLMSADHFGSGSKYETGEKISRLFVQPDLQVFEERSKSAKAHLYPLSAVSVDDSRQHTLVTAPTGAGKTDFLIRRCKNRIFYTLPFQASINAMYLRFKQDIPGDIRRLHSASKVNLEVKENLAKESSGRIEEPVEDQDLQKHPGATVKVMTPHQLASLVFLTPGHEAVALDIQGQDVVLDEVHTYSEESAIMILKIVQTLVLHGCRVHIGTATLPTLLANKLISLLGGENAVYRVALPPEKLDEFDRHIVHKTFDGRPIGSEEVLQILQQAVEAGEKVLLVANQVKRAQKLYQLLCEKYPKVPKVLIHSRYRRMDRAGLEKEIETLQKEGREGPAIAVATQVVEVSLDISYDRMITEAAPLDALIQRFGRVNRRRNETTIGNYKSVHIIAPSEKANEVLPYKLDLVKASYDALQDGTVMREREVQQLMDLVFHSMDIGTVPNEYMINDDGSYRLEKLRHQPRSTVVSALKIDGNTCILYSDLEKYRRAPFNEKPRYEIPVSGNFQSYEKLAIEESGSYPLLLPDDRYQFNSTSQLGLVGKDAVPTSSQLI